MVEDELRAGATVRTLGPLIHNTQEIQRLEAEGVRTIDVPGQVEGGITAVIRAHGVTPEVQRELEGRASKVWMPLPVRHQVQNLAERAAAGRDGVVVGTPTTGMIGVAVRPGTPSRPRRDCGSRPCRRSTHRCRLELRELKTSLKPPGRREKSDASRRCQHHLFGNARTAKRAARDLSVR